MTFKYSSVFGFAATLAFLATSSYLWGWKITLLAHLLRSVVFGVFLAASRVADPETRGHYIKAAK